MLAIYHAANDSASTAEGSFAKQIAICAEAYSKKHNGRPPASRADLEPYLDQPIDEVFR